MGISNSKDSSTGNNKNTNKSPRIDKEDSKKQENEQKTKKESANTTAVTKEETSPVNINRLTLNSTGGSFQQDIRQYYKFKEILGGGHFGTCRIGYRRGEEPRRFYAIKSISKKNLSTRDLEDLVREVEILSSLEHPNIVKFYETYHDQYYFHIVMELCKGKEVFDRIVEDGSITEQKVSMITSKILSAIAYCHSKGVTHRDLKPENILFETSENDAEIKLIDFGLSRKYITNEKMHTILGTPYYVAPEVLKGDYDEKCDVWSMGALCYIMLCGEPPFKGNSNHEIFHKIINEDLKFDKEKWKKISSEAKDFIKKCMTKGSENRFSAREALEHVWFKSILKQVHSHENLSKDVLENLRNFSSPQKFKKMVLRFLVNMLNQQEIKKLKQVFYAMDTDHTGHINNNELETAFAKAGINVTKEEIQKIIDAADGGKDGKLDYSEFLIACVNQKQFVDKEKLIYAFKYFDVDNSGYIDSSDLKDALLRSGKKIINSEQIDRMIEEVVSIKSQQKISLEEFLKLFDS